MHIACKFKCEPEKILEFAHKLHYGACMSQKKAKKEDTNKTFRIENDTLSKMKDVGDKYGISDTNVLKIAIIQLWEREFPDRRER